VIYFVEAWAALGANKLRSFLSLIGLIVGVGAVISIQILGHAMSGATSGIFQGLSNYTFLVFPNSQNGFDVKSAIKISDVEGLASIPNVALAIPFQQFYELARLDHNTAQLVVSPTGTQAEFFSQPLAEGRLITQSEIDGEAHACVASNNAATKLSPDGSSIVGRTVRAGRLLCKIVGVLKKAPAGATNFDFGSDLYVPYTTFERLYEAGRTTYEVQVLVSDVNAISQTENTVKARLAAQKNGKYTYQVFDNFLIAQQIDKVFGVLTLIVGVIAAISLVVAGIGIMNILLVSITERTREIGIRKAIGAQRLQILLQFFLESAILTFGGCALGTVLGIGIGYWINTVYIIKISGVIVPVPWVNSVILATVFAAIVTFAFGTYPAYRAAGLDPIEALRYE
jgi:putative ABC transport system permease protein